MVQLGQQDPYTIKENLKFLKAYLVQPEKIVEPLLVTDLTPNTPNRQKQDFENLWLNNRLKCSHNKV